MKDAALELAYAASDAYRYEAENLAVIDGVLDELGERAEITPLEFLKLREELHVVLTSNRTAPAVMKIMAMADAARICGLESSVCRQAARAPVLEEAPRQDHGRADTAARVHAGRAGRRAVLAGDGRFGQPS